MGLILEIGIVFYLPLFMRALIAMLIVFGLNGFAMFVMKIGIIILSAASFAVGISLVLAVGVCLFRGL